MQQKKSRVMVYTSSNQSGNIFMQANCAVCKADDSGATALSSSASSKDLYGTQSIGLYRKIRSWKSVSYLQFILSSRKINIFLSLFDTVFLFNFFLLKFLFWRWPSFKCWKSKWDPSHSEK